MSYPPGTTQFIHDEYEIEMDRLDGPSCSRCNDTGLIGTGRYHEREVCDCAADDQDPDICPPTIVDKEPDCPNCGRTLRPPYNACFTPSWVCGWVSENYEPTDGELSTFYHLGEV